MSLTKLFQNWLKPLDSILNKNFARWSASAGSRRTFAGGQGCPLPCNDKRRVKDPCAKEPDIGLVLGIYTNPDVIGDKGELTPTGDRYNKLVCNRVKDLLYFTGPPPKMGEVRILYNLEPEHAAVAIVGLGRECLGYDVYEKMDEGKEAIRLAAAVGSQALQQLNIRRILIESFGHAESAAEGSALGLWLYQERKHKDHRVRIPELDLYDDCDWTGWQIGLQKAAAQNFSRQLMDTAANLMTPTSFAQNSVEHLCKAGVNVEVKVKAWAETQKMNAFLAAAAGSCEPPIFLELSYYGAPKDERPVVMIGKGLTYNSGGLCIWSNKDQERMRGDMGGAACVVAAIRAIAGLQLPINIRGLVPLCENMPGCAACKPGNIVKAMNGKSIRIISTDVAGRLMIADALVYAQNFWPRFVIDVGTMHSGLQNVIGSACSGVFTNSEALWEYMLAASMHTGDRVWRFPLWNHFAELIRGSGSADLHTFYAKEGKSRSSGAPCECAAFLNEFVPCGDWLHLDIFNVMWSSGGDYPYLKAGMSGRPTRTLVEFLSQLVCNRD